MLRQKAFLFKFVFFLGNKETIGKISLTILVLVGKLRHHANDLHKTFETVLESQNKRREKLHYFYCFPTSCRCLITEGEEQGTKSPFSLLSEPISPSSQLFISSSRSIQFNSPFSHIFFFSLLPTFPPYFSLLPTFFGPFLPPPYSVPPPSVKLLKAMTFQLILPDFTLVKVNTTKKLRFRNQCFDTRV